jgi:hypothetical protein
MNLLLQGAEEFLEGTTSEGRGDKRGTSFEKYPIPL